MSYSFDTDPVVLARSLVAPEKDERDKTISGMAAYLESVEDATEMEMLKLWKALYYCLWLADKDAVQRELSSSLASLLYSFSNQDMVVLFIQMFFRTLLREWSALDQHRVNKFYVLIRLMLREIFTLLKSMEYSADAIDEILGAIEIEVLLKTPNGIRFHITDIYLSELSQVSEGVLNTQTFLLFLAPFFRSLTRLTTEGGLFQEKVKSNIFNNFITTFSKEQKCEDDEDSVICFSQVNSAYIQGYIFSIASDEDTPEGCRKRLYATHRLFPSVTGQKFVDIDAIDLTEEDAPKSKAKKSKKAKTPKDAAADVVDKKDVTKAKKKRTLEAAQQEEVPVPASTDKKQKKNKAAEVVPTPVKEAVKEKETPKKKDTKPSKTAAKNVVPFAEEPAMEMQSATPSKKSKKSDGDAAAPLADFMAQAKFAGAKKGYVFKKGAKGLGYYQDTQGAADIQAELKAVRTSMMPKKGGYQSQQKQSKGKFQHQQQRNSRRR